MGQKNKLSSQMGQNSKYGQIPASASKNKKIAN